MIGLGNKIDFDEVNAMACLAEDKQTKVTFCYLESLPRPRLFLEIEAEVIKKSP